jgi:hypothetical protein
MRRKYIVGPFSCGLAAWTYWNGSLPLLALYAIERGASQATSGHFLAFTYFCIALGNMVPGMLRFDNSSPLPFSLHSSPYPKASALPLLLT